MNENLQVYLNVTIKKWQKCIDKFMSSPSENSRKIFFIFHILLITCVQGHCNN